MKVIGLKYTGKREEGISVMLFRSYKTARITKSRPYRFTEKDRVDAEACNYYNKLAHLGLALITSESDFPVKVGRRAEVRKEPLAAEIDVQLDPTAKPETPADAMGSGLPPEEHENENLDQTQDAEDETADDAENNETHDADESENDVDNSDDAEDISHTPSEFSVDKEAIKSMSASELGEYLEMNFTRDQIKTLISDLDLNISVGRKGVPNLVGDILASASTDTLISYLCK